MRWWSKKRVGLLEAMHADGRRPVEIARALRTTPSAVRMKAHRLGLKFGPDKTGQPPLSAPAPNPPASLIDLVLGSAHSAAIAAPRQIAAYIAVVELNYAKAAVGRALGVSGPRIREMVARVEDRRDDPAVDAFVDLVAAQARELAA